MKAEPRFFLSEANAPSLAENSCLLSEQVRLAVERYFEQLNGYSASSLYDIVLQEVERPLIETVLAHCDHNQSKAAQVLGLSRSTLRKKMTQHGIE
jgi:Fis family transcriptional regulator